MRSLLLFVALAPLIPSSLANALPAQGRSEPVKAAKDLTPHEVTSPPLAAPTASQPASQPSANGAPKAASSTGDHEAGRAAEPVHIARLWERVLLDEASGAVLEVQIVLGERVPSELLLPVARGAKSDKLVVESAGKGLKAALRMVGGDPLLAIDTRGCAPRQELRLRYGATTLFDEKRRKAAPHGVTLETYRFVNTTHTRVDDYRAELIMPAGNVVQRIVSTRPPVNPKSPEIPYRVLGGAGSARRRLSMSCRALAIGDECALTYGRQPAERSSVPLFLGIALGLLYLWGFRSVLRSQ